jgi:hypothetical protein
MGKKENEENQQEEEADFKNFELSDLSHPSHESVFWGSDLVVFENDTGTIYNIRT